MNRSFGDILKEIRASKDMSQEDFAALLGTTKQVISRYENNQRTPKITIAKEYADTLRVSLPYLLGDVAQAQEPSRPLPSNIIPLPKMKKVPLVGRIACGTPILAEQNITDYVDIPGHVRADYALTCYGVSMIGAGIRDSDIVYIRQQDTVENGQIAAVMVDGDEATLKRFYYDGELVQLVSENPKIAPLVFAGEAIAAVRVLGLAVAFTHIIE